MDPLSDVIEDQNVPEELTGGSGAPNPRDDLEGYLNRRADEALSAKRARAGTIGAKRFHELVARGKKYEKEHGLTPGRERLKHLAALGRKYEQEKGLAPPPKRRKLRVKKGEEVLVLLEAIARVAKSQHRNAIEKILAELKQSR